MSLVIENLLQQTATPYELVEENHWARLFRMAYTTCTVISDDLIPDRGTIVFDWDNTLKLYNRETRQLSSRVEGESLRRWKLDKQCELYIISAISPSRINLETLLFEVRKLGLLEFFTKEEDPVEVRAGELARKGNIIICGYDKAETFLKVKQQSSIRNEDVVDSVHAVQREACGKGSCDLNSGDTVVFFDDEEVNIINFSAMVHNSICYLVK